MTTAVPFQLLSASARAALPAYRNLLINAQFLINQREYAGGAVFLAGGYTRDRWRCSTASQSIDFTTTAGQAVAPAGGMEQLIEAYRVPAGPYVLSWEGTATAQVNGVAVAKGGVVQIAGVANCSVKFFGGTVKEPQFESGTVVTNFERPPMPIERAMCREYYRRMNVSASSPVVGVNWIPFAIEPPMRATPSPGGISGGTASNGSFLLPVVVAAEGGYFRFTTTVAGGSAVGAIIQLDAELVS